MSIKSQSEYVIRKGSNDGSLLHILSPTTALRVLKKIMCVFLNAMHRRPAAKRYYIAKGANPIESEPRKTGVGDLVCVLGDDIDDTLSVIDSVEAVTSKRLSWTEFCDGKSGREVFFSRRSVGRFLCFKGRKEEPDNNQWKLNISRHVKKTH